MPANREIEVSVQNVYGRDLIYPANEAAKRVANIAGTKTLSVQNLVDAIAIGCRVTYTAHRGAEKLRDAMLEALHTQELVMDLGDDEPREYKRFLEVA